MSTIDTYSLLDSGPHQWHWPGGQRITEKKLETAGTRGTAGLVTHEGTMPVRITGLLRANSDSEMNTLVSAIRAYCRTRRIVSWSDNMGQSGDYLVVMDIMTQPRTYGGGGTRVFQKYTLLAEERAGGPE